MTTPPPGLVPCPDCRQGLPPNATTCPACGIRLTGPDAARLWQVDQTLASLATERITLLTRLREPVAAPADGTPVAGAPTVGADGRPAAVPGDPTAPGGPDGPPGATTPTRASSWTVQQLLLGGGVVLLLVAALVFVAVSWERLGTFGQVAVLGAATAGTMLAARLLAGRGLHSSAEAVALLTCGLAVLDVASVQQYGLFGSDRVAGATYWSIALPVLALVLLLGHLLTRRAHCYPVLAVLTTGLWPALIAFALDLRSGGFTVVAALAWGLGALATALARPARRSVRATIALVSVCWLTCGALVASVDAWLHSPWQRGALAATSLTAITLVAAAVARRTRTTGTVRDVVRGTARLLALMTILIVLHHLGAWTMVAVSALGSAALALPALATVRPGRAVATAREVIARAAGRRSGAVWLVALVVGAGLVASADYHHARYHLGSWLAIACLGGAARAFAEGTSGRRAWSVYAAVPGASAAAVAANALPTATAAVAALCAVGALAGAAAMVRRARAEELGLGAGAALALVLAVVAATDSAHPHPLVALALGVAGLLLLACSSLPERGIAAVPAVVLCSAATWSLSTGRDVTLLEAYTLPLAVLALAVGLVRRHRVPAAPSWTTVGPGLSAGLIPSALATYGDDALARPVLVLAAGVLVTAVGVLVRLQAPVVTGVAATVLVAVSQAGPWVVALPRAASLGAAGLILLVMGLRYEAARHQARSTRRWVRALG